MEVSLKGLHTDDCIYKTFWKDQNYRHKKNSWLLWIWAMEEQICVIQIFRLIKSFCINIVMLDTLNYAFGKTQRIIEQNEWNQHKLWSEVKWILSAWNQSLQPHGLVAQQALPRWTPGSIEGGYPGIFWLRYWNRLLNSRQML